MCVFSLDLHLVAYSQVHIWSSSLARFAQLSRCIVHVVDCFRLVILIVYCYKDYPGLGNRSILQYPGTLVDEVSPRKNRNIYPWHLMFPVFIPHTRAYSLL